MNVDIVNYTLSRELDKLKRRRRSAERDLETIKVKYEAAMAEVEYHIHCEKEIMNKIGDNYLKKMSEAELEKVKRKKYMSSVAYKRRGITEQSI